MLQLSVLSFELRQKLPSEVTSYKLEVLQPGIFSESLHSDTEDLGAHVVLVQNHSECSHLLLYPLISVNEGHPSTSVVGQCRTL